MDLKSFKHRLAFLVQELTADCAQSRWTLADAGRPRAAGGGESACVFADLLESTRCLVALPKVVELVEHSEDTNLKGGP